MCPLVPVLRAFGAQTDCSDGLNWGGEGCQEGCWAGGEELGYSGADMRCLTLGGDVGRCPGGQGMCPWNTPACEVRQEELCSWATPMPRGTQAMLAPVGLILLLLAVGGKCEDVVAANVGYHTMSRIAELLSPSECRQLQGWLTGPDKDLGELEQLSEENNPIHPRRRRDLRGLAGCSEALQDWLRTAGEVMTWDWLARGLHQIGRPDIALELGKNLNQDRSLELRRNVEEYGRTIQHLTSSLLREDERHGGARGRRAPDGDLGDLRFERRLPPPYTRSLLGWVGPVVLGILGGFLASVLFAATAVYSCRWTLGLDAT